VSDEEGGLLQGGDAGREVGLAAVGRRREKRTGKKRRARFRMPKEMGGGGEVPVR